MEGEQVLGTVHVAPGHQVLGGRRYNRIRAKRRQLETFKGPLPESQGQNVALTVEHVPYSLNSGKAMR